jgi:protein ImuA
MATQAVARETICALRRQIAKIEGSLAEVLAPAGDAGPAQGLVMRRNGVAATGGHFLATGIEAMDLALGGGIPTAALTEIHGAETRDAGAVAGFVLSLVCLLLKQAEDKAPILWIGTAEVFREAGPPYALGLCGRFGISPEDLLVAEVPKLVDALWVAEEAARLKALSVVLLEVRGNAQGLDLTATRRLHRKAQEAGRPVFLLRQGAEAQPTAAPVRLVISPAQAGLRRMTGGLLARSIGPPGFVVAIGKSRIALQGQFELEWNPDEHAFQERQPERSIAEDPVALVSLSQYRANPTAATGAVLAFRSGGGKATAGHQPAGEQRPAHRRS